MKRLFPVFVAVCLFFYPFLSFGAGTLEDGMQELASKIVQNSIENDKNSIAIAAFPHTNGDVSELSNYLADELVLKLFNVPDSHLTIMERSQLNKIFQEMSLSQSGVVDVETIQQLGQLHGVDALIIGSITEMGESIRINARMTDTETGKVFSAAGTTIAKTATTSELLSRILFSPDSNRKKSGAKKTGMSVSGSQSLSKKPAQTATEETTALQIDLAHYEIGDLLSEFSTDLIVTERKGERFIQSLNNNGELTIDNLHLSGHFELVFTADWNDFTQNIILYSDSGSQVQLQFANDMIIFGPTKKQYSYTPWKGGIHVNKCRLIIKGNVAKLFINDKFFGTMIIPADLIITKLTMSGIKQNDFVNNIGLKSL